MWGTLTISGDGVRCDWLAGTCESRNAGTRNGTRNGPERIITIDFARLQIQSACLLHPQTPTACFLHLQTSTAWLLHFQIPTACLLHFQIPTACLPHSCTSRYPCCLHLQVSTACLLHLLIPTVCLLHFQNTHCLPPDTLFQCGLHL